MYDAKYAVRSLSATAIGPKAYNSVLDKPSSHKVKIMRGTPIHLLNLLSHQPLHRSLRRHRNYIRFRHPIVLFTLPQKDLHIPPATQRDSHISSRQSHTPTRQLSCLSGPKVCSQVSIPRSLCQRRRLITLRPPQHSMHIRVFIVQPPQKNIPLSLRMCTLSPPNMNLVPPPQTLTSM